MRSCAHFGRSITIDSRPRAIVGVMPQGFRVANTEPELIAPIGLDRSQMFLVPFNFQTVARLKSGVTIAEANADLRRLAPVWLNTWSMPPGLGGNPRGFESWRIVSTVRPLKEDVIGTVGNVLWVLMGTIGIVMLIGVVEDVRENGVHAAAPPIVYWPSMLENLFQAGQADVIRSATFVVRSPRAGTEGLVDAARRAVWSVNSNLPVALVRTMEDVYAQSMARTSFTLVMLAIAAAMALVLGIVGIYAVIAYAMAQRTREIGIRVALGAQHGEVRRMFVRYGLVLASVGVAIGLGVAASLTRFMTSLLFEVSPLDPITYVAVSMVLITTALLAAYLPARRASLVDPTVSLRAQ